MTKGRNERAAWPLSRWGVYGLLAAALVIAMLLIRESWRSDPLEPLPEISLVHLDFEVKRIVERAVENARRDSRSPIAWGDLGAVYRAHEFGPEAEACFRNAQRLDPSDYRWPYLLAVSLSATDRKQAVPLFHRAAELAPDRPHVQMHLAEALIDCDDPSQAARVIERVLQQSPADPRAQLAKARILYAEGRFAESRTWCERSIAGSPHKRASHLLLAQLCRRLSDLKGQVRETEILSSIPDGPTGWNDPDVEAIVALRRDPGLQLEALDQMAAEGRAEESMAILASMAKGADPSGYATGRLVRALVAQNRLREAESVLREKVTGYPAGERFAFHLGIVLALQKKFDEAADEFRRVTELKPDHVDAHFNLGLALVDANRDQEAGQAFAQTVRLSPGHIEARVHLAELLIDAGRAAEARPHLQVAARLAPRDAKVSELLARLPKAP